VTWVAVIVTLLFLTPLFAPLPEAVLAALIIHAVWHIIAARKLQRVRAVSRTEFWLGALALAGVLLIDVLEGMMIGLVASMLLVIYRSSRPHLSSLGRVPDVPGAFSDLGRHPENQAIPGVLITRLDAPMYYANALTVRDRVRALVAETHPRVLILDAEGQEDLDITSAEVLVATVKSLHASGIIVLVAQAHGPVLEAARPFGLDQLVGDANFFPTLEAAVRAAEDHLAQPT
jgi:sulfate permease, SulP family